MFSNQFLEPRCGALTGAAISLPLSPCDVDAPQPLVDRRPSVSLLKWSSSKRNDAPTPTAARQGLDYFFNNLHCSCSNKLLKIIQIYELVIYYLPKIVNESTDNFVLYTISFRIKGLASPAAN